MNFYLNLLYLGTIGTGVLDWHLLITVVKIMVDALNLAKVGQSSGF